MKTTRYITGKSDRQARLRNMGYYSFLTLTAFLLSFYVRFSLGQEYPYVPLTRVEVKVTNGKSTNKLEGYLYSFDDSILCLLKQTEFDKKISLEEAVYVVDKRLEKVYPELFLQINSDSIKRIRFQASNDLKYDLYYQGERTRADILLNRHSLTKMMTDENYIHQRKALDMKYYKKNKIDLFEIEIVFADEARGTSTGYLYRITSDSVWIINGETAKEELGANPKLVLKNEKTGIENLSLQKVSVGDLKTIKIFAREGTVEKSTLIGAGIGGATFGAIGAVLVADGNRGSSGGSGEGFFDGGLSIEIHPGLGALIMAPIGMGVGALGGLIAGNSKLRKETKQYHFQQHPYQGYRAYFVGKYRSIYWQMHQKVDSEPETQ